MTDLVEWAGLGLAIFGSIVTGWFVYQALLNVLPQYSYRFDVDPDVVRIVIGPPVKREKMYSFRFTINNRTSRDARFHFEFKVPMELYMLNRDEMRVYGVRIEDASSGANLEMNEVLVPARNSRRLCIRAYGAAAWADPPRFEFEIADDRRGRLGVRETRTLPVRRTD
jgi:hypothetical protein